MYSSIIMFTLILSRILTSFISHISDMADMEGGELEIIKMEKYDGMKALTEGSLKKEVRQLFSFQDLEDENDVNACPGH